MTEESWRTTETSQAEIERDTARAMSGIQSKQYKDRDAHLKSLVQDRKAEIWERKAMKEKGTKKMWSIFRNLTTNKTSDTAHIISENGKKDVSPKQKANALVKLYRTVSEIPDRGLEKLLNDRLRSEPVHSEECGKFNLSEINAALKSLNPSKAPVMSKSSYTFSSWIRTDRSTEDQLLRLSQSISDGFQRIPMQRMVMALIDYSRAYDKVWRNALFFKIQQMGTPTKRIRRVQTWLSNRLTWMTFDGEKSKTVNLKQGVLLGEVLSPLVFFYINDLPNGITQSNVSLFADDVAIWS